MVEGLRLASLGEEGEERTVGGKVMDGGEERRKSPSAFQPFAVSMWLSRSGPCRSDLLFELGRWQREKEGGEERRKIEFETRFSAQGRKAETLSALKTQNRDREDPVVKSLI